MGMRQIVAVWAGPLPSFIATATRLFAYEKKKYMKYFLLCSALILSGCSAMQATTPDQPPKIIQSSCPQPVYPSQSVAAREAGTVILNVHVSKEGDPIGSSIFVSSGHPLLDNAAADIFSKCKFSPSIQSGKPTETWIKQEFVWKLQ